MRSSRIILILAAASATHALAQPFTVDRLSISSGGGSLGTNGLFSATVTIGQSVAAAAGTNTTEYAAASGFWTLFGFPTWAGVVTNTDYGVGFCSNRITGTLRFNNSNPAILSLLNAPGVEGMGEWYVYSSSLSGDRSSVSGWQPANSGSSSDYAVAVDADCTNTAGTAYVVTPLVSLGLAEQEYYYFKPQTSAPVVAGLAGPVVDFEECLGVVQFNFADVSGTPVSLSGGTITPFFAYDPIVRSIPAGSTQQRLYVRGGEPHFLALRLYRGNSVYTDQQVHYVTTNITVACDGIVNINIIIPAAGALGQITGTADILREFEWTVPGWNNLPDLSGVIANYGPFYNQRWAALPGDNATVPSSGAFQLVNVVPSSVDPASPGYAVQAQMLIRSNRMVESFWTPALGYGSNPPVVVTPGSTVNLSNIFVIDPGYVRGGMRLQGPAEVPGYESMLRGFFHCGDDDRNHDGIPDQIGFTRGVYWSFVEYDGVDRRANGAQYTAAYGFGWGDFDGNFDAASSAYAGHYELALGGLQGERSLWRPAYLGVALGSAEWNDREGDYSLRYGIEEHNTAAVEIAPNQASTNDLAYGFSEVIVRIYSPTTDFMVPVVQFSGRYTGTNFIGQPADYDVKYGYAYGTPYYYPSNHAQVRMLLPQGTYTLQPQIEAGVGIVGLASIDVTVGVGQRLDLGTCLRVDASIPAHASSNQLNMAGSVLTQCDNHVVELSYELNGGAPVIVCNNCGANPAFAFTAALVSGANTLTLTARDDQGTVSSISGVIQLDEPAPTLGIAFTSAGAIIVSWPSPSSGFRLEQTSELGGGGWSAPSETINDNGLSKFIIVNQPAGKRFYRLVKP